MTALAAWDADLAAVVGWIGLPGPAARKSSWPLNGAVGDAAPYGLVEGWWTSEN